VIRTLGHELQVTRGRRTVLTGTPLEVSDYLRRNVAPGDTVLREEPDGYLVRDQSFGRRRHWRH
jgi:hypothetical protein